MPKAPKKKTVPRKPQNFGQLIDPMWARVFRDSSEYQFWCDLQIRGGSPAEARRLAAWLLSFAAWAEWKRERDDA